MRFVSYSGSSTAERDASPAAHFVTAISPRPRQLAKLLADNQNVSLFVTRFCMPMSLGDLCQ